jgi:putative ABC transport system permease protein
MFQNYLKIAIRNLAQHKAFSFINIFGLALSMSVCLMVISIIKDAHSYDLFHPEAERTYRIITEAQRKGGGSEGYASSPYLVAKTLTDDYPQVELWTPMLLSLSGEAKAGGRQLPELRGMYTDGSFFEMFGFQMAQGNPATALTEPFSLVLTEETAQKFFPDEKEKVVGKEIEMPAYGTFKVTGILKKAPGKTHLQFDALGSLATHLSLEKQPDAWNITGDWLNYYGGYHYVRLKPGVPPETAELALAEIAKTKYADLELESRDEGYRFELQALGDITPGRMLSQTNGPTIPTVALWFLSALAFIIMLAAAFNYTNLTIARSLLRTKEVGIRKVMGATRQQVFGQISIESVLTSLLALVLAYCFFKFGKTMFNQGMGAELVNMMGEEDVATVGWFLLFAIAVGLFAGALPAATLSKASPMQILQKLQNLRFIQWVGLRKALLGFQFTITLVFLFVLTIMHKQVNYALTQTFGFDKPQTLLMEMQGQPYDQLSAVFSQVSGVEKMSAISHPMGTNADWSDDVRSDSVTEKTSVRCYFVDDQYLDHFGLPLLAGENFPDNPTQQRELFVLVNERFCERFKLGTPAEAAGKILTLGDSTRVSVKGILKDFAFKPANYAIEPMFLRYAPNQLNILNLELAGGDVPATMLALERTWKQLQPDSAFDAVFFDERVRRNYSEMLGLAWVIGFLGLLGMVIACLGLLGMAMYSVETKAKEISVRKVMGASALDLTLLLSKGYFIVMGIALLVAAPLTFFLSKMMLQEFAQRISLTPLLFLPGLLLLLLVAGVTVGSQTVKAALADPVKSLRTE